MSGFRFLGLVPLEYVMSFLYYEVGWTVVYSGASNHPRKALANVPVIPRFRPYYCISTSL